MGPAGPLLVRLGFGFGVVVAGGAWMAVMGVRTLATVDVGSARTMEAGGESSMLRVEAKALKGTRAMA